MRIPSRLWAAWIVVVSGGGCGQDTVEWELEATAGSEGLSWQLELRSGACDGAVVYSALLGAAEPASLPPGVYGFAARGFDPGTCRVFREGCSMVELPRSEPVRVSASACDGRCPPSGLSCTPGLLSAGRAHSCASPEADRPLLCWGRNQDGELGPGTASPADAAPAEVVGPLVGARSVSLGGDLAKNSHSCAVTAEAEVQCWGAGESGQLGDGSLSDRAVPAAAEDLENATMVAAGGRHSCAIAEGGALFCWGDNGAGQVGSASSPAAVPIRVWEELGPFLFVDAGEEHTCAIDEEGSVWCWGLSDDERLGAPGDGSAPARVTLPGSARQVSCGFQHSCAVLESGRVFCWGRNAEGELGRGSAGSPAGPGEVTRDLPFLEVSAGREHSCARAADGAVFCWGSNQFGAAGTGTTGGQVVAPLRVEGLEARRVDVHSDHSCALAPGGSLFCWGQGDEGRLGDGTSTLRSAPTPVLGFP